jgi:glycosyltransferase involved in cell wall biosynthesis
VLFDNAHISNIPLSLFTKMLGCKQYFTIHDWDPHPGSSHFVTALYNTLVKRFLANEFIVYSPVSSNKAVHCFYLGGFPVKPYKFHSDYFLFYGRIEPYKGLNYLVPIADELAKRNPNLKIIVAGKGKDTILEKLALKENVKVINKFIDQSELDDLISGAIAILLPYESASQSGVIPQVAGFGKSVIAHDVGSISYYINDRLPLGTLVNKGDVSGFVKAMLLNFRNYEVVTREVRASYGPLSRNAYIKQFDTLFTE